MKLKIEKNLSINNSHEAMMIIFEITDFITNMSYAMNRGDIPDYTEIKVTIEYLEDE